MAAQALMKDSLGEAAVARICRALLASGASFSEHAFTRDALDSLAPLELKERVQHIIDVMGKYLPSDFEQTATILGRIRDHWEETEETLSSFAAWPIIDYVAQYGLDHPRIALPLLRYLTPMFSAEFAVRPFLEKHNQDTYGEMLLWCLDSNEHVRRLASEGIRPRLPWAKQLPRYIENPAPVITLLESLKDDPSDYVRRSVANNLNDISKDHPDLVIEICKQWKSEKVAARRWIIQRATRTLVKNGHRKVFPLLGFTRKPKLDITPLVLSSDTVRLGESLHFSTQITSTAAVKQSCVIDFAIHYVRAKGKTSRKVFKLKNLRIKPGECITLEKSHPFKKITTRKHYAGTHKIEILVNGRRADRASFQLQP